MGNVNPRCERRVALLVLRDLAARIVDVVSKEARSLGPRREGRVSRELWNGASVA